MKDYNFAKNYENIKLWEQKEQSVDFSEENNYQQVNLPQGLHPIV